MKKVGYTLVFFVIVAVVAVGGALYWWRNNTSALDPASEKEQRFIVPKGKGATEIGYMLEEESFIKNQLAFKIYVQLHGKQESINAGEFSLSPSMTLEEIVDALGKGPLEVWVTIPEGLRREQVLAAIVKGLNRDDDVFRREFLDATKKSEGYLFPDTYLFAPDVDAAKVVSLLENTHHKRMEEVKNTSGYALELVVIMASLLERETITDAERPIVAGILWKRLEADWPLQVDASVQYVVNECGVMEINCDDWWPILTASDLETKSSYNTYLNQGLPPTPIASPGLSSLAAAANPQESKYWFYIHDADGVIHYGQTLEEHNANISEYLR